MRAQKLVCLYHPQSAKAELFRTLRTNIQFTVLNKGMKGIMLTSARPGEGKSTLISNLAVTLAESDQQVLLIDADFRMPHIHHLFQISNHQGLSNLLMNSLKWEDVITQVADIWLDILPSGPSPANPADLLGSRRMKELLEELKEQYEVILIDTPPLLTVADAQLLASLADGVLLVIESGKVSVEDAKKVKGMLEYAGANLLGAVFNDKEQETIAYY